MSDFKVRNRIGLLSNILSIRAHCLAAPVEKVNAHQSLVVATVLSGGMVNRR
jgi:hypothetical protein